MGGAALFFPYMIINGQIHKKRTGNKTWCRRTSLAACATISLSIFTGYQTKNVIKDQPGPIDLHIFAIRWKFLLKKKKKIIFWFFCLLGSSFIIRGILTLSTVSLILKLSCYYYYQYYVFHCIWTTSMHTRHRSTRSSRSFQRYRGEWDLSSVDQSFLRFLHQTWKECYVYILLNCCCCCCWFLWAILHR